MTAIEPSPQPVRRRYRSPLRTERALATRSRIATAARELFAANGFAGTTVAGIADRAGVTPQTVYASFGSKGAIVRALLTQFEDDAEGGLWRDRIAAESDPHRKLAGFADWSAHMFSSSKAVIAAARGAAADPAILELREQGDQHRRLALSELVSDLRSAGALRPELTTDRAVDRAWALTSVDLYLATTDGCGWTDTEYAEWLAHLLQDQLLGRPDTTRTHPV